MINRFHSSIAADEVHDGEKKVIDALREALSDSWALAQGVLLPDRKRDYAPDETDIVLIGPPGVYSVEVKWWTGEVFGNWGTSWIYQRRRNSLTAESRKNPIPIAKIKSSILYNTLRSSLRGTIPQIRPMVIFPPADLCKLNISDPGYTIKFPVMDIDEAIKFFKGEEARVGRSGRGKRSKRSHHTQVDRIFSLFRGKKVVSRDSKVSAGAYILHHSLPEKENDLYTSYFGYNSFAPTENVLIKKLKLHEHLPAKKYEEMRDRLLREARALLVLRGHPNVLQTYGPFAHAGELYVAYEWFDGPSLTDIIDNEDVDYDSIELLKNVMMPILDVIRVAHANDIGHRNLTPDCIVVSPDGTVKITDFALARFFLDRTLQNLTALDLSAYTAPETLVTDDKTKQVSYKPKIDIYSLGAICYEIVTGFPPNPPHKRMSDELSFKSRKPEVSSEIKVVIQKAMSLAGGRRYKNVGEMIEAMDKALMAQPHKN